MRNTYVSAQANEEDTAFGIVYTNEINCIKGAKFDTPTYVGIKLMKKAVIYIF